MNELTPENYDKAVKIYNKICIEWNLSSYEIGSQNGLATPENSFLMTMSRVFSIYRSLHTLFNDHDQANSWVRKENTILGLPAIQLMKSDVGLEKVQRHLSSQVR